jgi:hypothetical protein
MMAGHPEEARAALSQALELNTAQGLVARANDNLLALGHVNLLTGDVTAAAEQYRTVLRESHEMGDASRVQLRLSAVASLLTATGHHDEALRIAGAVQRLHDEQGGMVSISHPGITDPVTGARRAGFTEAQIEERLADGRSMDLNAAVDLALNTPALIP